MARNVIEILAVLGCALILYACSDKGTDGGDDKLTGYYVYAHGYWSSPRNYGLIYKIDADLDSVVDSTRYPNDLLFLHTTPDGKELWGMGPQMTVVWNTADLSEKRRIEGLGALIPFFDTDTSYFVLVGIEHRRIYIMDGNTGGIIGYDTIPGSDTWYDAYHDPERHLVIGISLSAPREVYFFDYHLRAVVDTVTLTDALGNPTLISSPTLSPNKDLIYGFWGGGGLDRSWQVFDLQSGHLLHEQSVSSFGDFVFFDDGRKVAITSPGNCRDVPASPLLPIHDTRNFAKVGELFLECDSLVALPGDPLTAYHGVGLPNSSRAYIGCGTFCSQGPLLVIDCCPAIIQKHLFLSPHIGFEAITIGRK